jgi:hypothetical protein
MAGLAAKLDGFRIVVTLVTANSGYQQKHDRAQQEKAEETPIAHARKVNPDRRKRSRILHNLTMPKKSTQPREQ